MLGFPTLQRNVKEQDPDRETFIRIRNGEAQPREALLRQYAPLAARMAGKWTGQSSGVADSDAYSIALQALDEAAMSYNPDKNRTFSGFAASVIKKRLIDEWRRTSKHRRSIPFSAFQDEEEENNPLEDTWLASIDPDQDDRLTLKKDLAALINTLRTFNLEMKDIYDAAPKHADARLTSINIAIVLAEDHDLYGQLIRKRSIPLARLARKSGVNIKTVERHRTYILLVALVWNSQMDSLKEYIESTLKGGASHERM